MLEGSLTVSVINCKLVRRSTTRPWYNIRTGTSVYHPAMVQHSTWYVGVPPDHGTTFDLVCRCTTQPWYNIQTGTLVYHLAMVQHLNWYVDVPPGHGTTFKLVRRCRDTMMALSYDLTGIIYCGVPITFFSRESEKKKAIKDRRKIYLPCPKKLTITAMHHKKVKQDITICLELYNLMSYQHRTYGEGIHQYVGGILYAE